MEITEVENIDSWSPKMKAPMIEKKCTESHTSAKLGLPGADCSRRFMRRKVVTYAKRT
jgi:hypothetical protein